MTLTEIKNIIEQLAVKICAPTYLLPTFGHSNDDARPHVEIDKNGQLYYVVVERGKECLRHSALDLDDLLYRVFEGITFSMASKIEQKKRVPEQDTRRIFFVEQEKLLGELNKEWQLRKREDHRGILISYPFDDNAITRVDYYRRLVLDSNNVGNEWRLACEKYPLPKHN